MMKQQKKKNTWVEKQHLVLGHLLYSSMCKMLKQNKIYIWVDLKIIQQIKP